MERGFCCEISDSIVFTRVVKRTAWGFGDQIWLFACRLLEWQRRWSGVLVSCCVVVGRAIVGCGLVLWFIGGWISSRIAMSEGRKEDGVVILGLIAALSSFSYRISLKLGSHYEFFYR
uniref:Transmembrane protein n=1 Tax=Solanum lycopersicum TaxID=4081 RepID=A0A3Q7GIX7_SOLLC